MRIGNKLITVELEKEIEHYSKLYNFRIINTLNRSVKDIKKYLKRYPKSIKICVGAGPPYSRYNIKNECLEIFLFPRFFKSLKKGRERDLIFEYIFCHEILEAMQNTPFGFKRIFESLYASMTPALNNSSLGLEPSRESLELFCQDTCIDIGVDFSVINHRRVARGFLLAHESTWGLDQFDMNRFIVEKSGNKFLSSNIDPYYLLYLLISCTRRKVICNEIKKTHPELAFMNMARYEAQFSRLIHKNLRYPEAIKEAYEMKKELDTKTPDPEKVYTHAKNILNFFEGVHSC